MSQQSIMSILLEPKVTEKSSMIGELNNQYVFKVSKNATKPEIKKAVELMFEGAEVESVQVTNVKGKRKIFKRNIFKTILLKNV